MVGHRMAELVRDPVSREGAGFAMMLAVAALALLLSACDPQDPPSLESPDTTLVVSSDPALKSRVAELLPELVEKAGMDLVRPVRVERRSRRQLEGYLMAKLDQELPPERARNMSRSYALLGLVDPGLDLRELFLSVYSEQVAGFYDPDSTALFVMDDMPVELLEPILIHELVHAVQDQTVSLDSLTAQGRGNDRQAAAQAAIEGHATLVMLEYMLEKLQGRPVDLSTLPDVSQVLGPALEGMGGQYPALASAPVIVQESLLFPYLKGASFVAELWQARPGRPAPFDRYLPQSTQQILDPSRLLGPEPHWPTELDVLPDDGYRVRYQNTLGQMETGVLLEEHLGPGSRALAQGWGGDRYLLLEDPSGGEVLLWLSVWDSETEQDRFAAGLEGALHRFPAPTVLRKAEILGRPGVIFQAGTLSELSFQVREGAPR
jgi:hypothetical protein